MVVISQSFHATLYINRHQRDQSLTCRQLSRHFVRTCQIGWGGLCSSQQRVHLFLMDNVNDFFSYQINKRIVTPSLATSYPTSKVCGSAFTPLTPSTEMCFFGWSTFDFLCSYNMCFYTCDKRFRRICRCMSSCMLELKLFILKFNVLVILAVGNVAVMDLQSLWPRLHCLDLFLDNFSWCTCRIWASSQPLGLFYHKNDVRLGSSRPDERHCRR